MPMLQVQRISDFVTLDRLRSEWNELSGGIPFRTYQWLGTWAETYLLSGRLYILSATDQGKLVGLLPLYQSGSAGGGQVLQWLGSGEVCTDYLGVMARDSFRSNVIDAFAGWLTEAAGTREHRWDQIQLDGVDDEEQTIVELTRKLADFECTVYQEPGLNCWRIELPETWDEYLALMSKSHRKQLRRVERRLHDDKDTEVLSVDDERSFAAGMEALVHLHQKRRESLDEPGCFASQQFSDFLHKAALRLLASGSLRLSWAEVAGEPIGVEFQLAGQSMTFAYQAGVDPDRMDLEPGRMIMIATIQKAIASGQNAFDFLRGDEPYKAHWRATPRPTQNLRIIAPKTASQLRHSIWLAGSSLKGFVQSTMSSSGS